jgi:CBS domain-containing protein
MLLRQAAGLRGEFTRRFTTASRGKVQNCLVNSCFASKTFKIKESATVFEVITEFKRHNIGCLLLTHDDDVDVITGVVTERDYIQKFALVLGRNPTTTPVKAIATPGDQIVFVTVDDEVET